MNRLVMALERLTAAISILCVALIMLIVSYDAMARYVFRAPLPWAFELISNYLLLTATYMAVSFTFQRGDHVNIDIFRMMIPNRMKVILDILWSLLAAAIFTVISYGSFVEMAGAWDRGEFLPGYIAWPAWLSYFPIAVGFALVALRLVTHALTLSLLGIDRNVIEHNQEETDAEGCYE